MTHETLQEPDPANYSLLTSRRLLIDVSLIAFHDAGTGIQRVVRALWTQLGTAPLPGLELYPVVATKTVPYQLCRANFIDQPLHLAELNGAQVMAMPGDIFLALDFAPSILPRHERQIEEWKADGASVHIIVYDLLPLKCRRWFRRKARHNFRRWLRVVERQADQVLCISDTVAEEVKAWSNRLALYVRRKFQISRIHLGSDLEGSSSPPKDEENSDELLGWFGEADTILMVGTIEPRKAYDKAIAAFENLWRNGGECQLAIVGRPGWRTKNLQKNMQRLARTNTRFCWIQDASDTTLDILYRRCKGLLITSYAEGLGLPLVEAAAYGASILARDIGVFRELNINGLSFFRNDKPAALAADILHWLQKPLFQENATAAPPCKWHDTAQELVRLIAPP